MVAQRTAVLVNPWSANRRTAKRWPALKRAIDEAIGPFTPLITEHGGHATQLVRQALRDGHDRIISVGGDGTHCEVVNGFFDGTAMINPDALLSLLPQGTGSDLARTLGISKRQSVAELLAADTTAAVDVGRVAYATEEGGTELRHFINVAHIGMGGDVAERANRTTKVFGGFASYLWSVMRTLMAHKNAEMTLTIDDVCFTRRCRDVIIGNGRYEGGGMLSAPEASLDSGTFDVYVLGDISSAQVVANLHRLYTGRLMERPDLAQQFKARRLVAESPERVLLNLDGEQCGMLPATFDVLPGALKLLRPEG